MKSDLPFIHFLSQGENSLLSPREIECNLNSGSFFAPLDNGNLYPYYNFHFAYYLAEGCFIKNPKAEEVDSNIFTGIAKREGLSRLILMFQDFPHIALESCGLPAVKYTGKLIHRDFMSSFVELFSQPEDAFDEMLLKYRVSVIGCDPTTKYKEM